VSFEPVSAAVGFDSLHLASHPSFELLGRGRSRHVDERVESVEQLCATQGVDPSCAAPDRVDVTHRDLSLVERLANATV